MYLVLGKKPGIFDVVIVNDHLEDAYNQLKNSVLEVSKVTTSVYQQPTRQFYTHTHTTFVKQWQLYL